MIQASIIRFLTALKKNNNKPWFDAHRDEYDAAKSEFIVFVDGLISSIAKFDPPIGNLKAKECMFRINRDVRFSKEKHPYKTNMAAYFNKDGKKGKGAGYYMHIEPGKSFVAAGIWMPEADTLSSIRQEIDYNYKEFMKILSNAGFKKHFTNGIEAPEKLVRPPKGYTDDNPALPYLKMKGYILSRAFTDKELYDKKLIANLGNTLKTAKPLVDFINRSLD